MAADRAVASWYGPVMRISSASAIALGTLFFLAPAHGAEEGKAPLRRMAVTVDDLPVSLGSRHDEAQPG